jgi:DNA-binding response OmpR family regulator
VLDDAIGRSFEAGCDTHVSKPVRRPVLVAAIREAASAAQRKAQSANQPAEDTESADPAADTGQPSVRRNPVRKNGPTLPTDPPYRMRGLPWNNH